MTAPAPGTLHDIDRDAVLAAIRADVRELTEPMTLRAGYWHDQPNGHSTAETNLVELPDLIEQLVDAAAEPDKVEQIPASGSVFKSRPPLDLDPHAVMRQITQQARGWIHTVAPQRDFDVEAANLRRQLDTAGRHLRAHERNLRLARRRMAAADDLALKVGVDHPSYDAVRARGRELADLVAEVGSYVTAWQFEVSRLKDRVVSAEGPRGAVLALNGLAGQLDDRALLDLAGATRRWVSRARIAAHVDDRPVQLAEHCPNCGARASITVSRGEYSTARCSSCRRVWPHEEIGLLTRMLDAQRDAARDVDQEITVQDEPVLAAIRATLLSAGKSRADFAELLGKSKRHVVQVLAGSARGGDRLLWLMVEKAVGLDGDHAPQLLHDLTATRRRAAP